MSTFPDLEERAAAVGGVIMETDYDTFVYVSSVRGVHVSCVGRPGLTQAIGADERKVAPCFLCGKSAMTRRGVAYYRFYSDAKPGWVSEPICTPCFRKLKGPSEQEKEEARDRADVEAQRLETYEGGPLPDANYFDHDF